MSDNKAVNKKNVKTETKGTKEEPNPVASTQVAATVAPSNAPSSKVPDVVAEIKPNTVSDNNDTATTESFKNDLVKEKLRQTLEDKMQSVDDLEIELDKIHKKINNEQMALHKIKMQSNSNMSKIENSNKQISNLTQKDKELTEELKKLKNTKNENKQELELNEIQNRKEKLNIIKEMLKEEKGMRKKIEKDRKEKEDLEDRVDELEEVLESLKTKISDWKKSVLNLKKGKKMDFDENKTGLEVPVVMVSVTGLVSMMAIMVYSMNVMCRT